MDATALGIEGAWKIDAPVHSDERGYFSEWFSPTLAGALLEREWVTAQANVSRSNRGVVRGVHFALVPPGQAKWVTCLEGAIRDFVVDIRPDSPTFGQHVAVDLVAGSGGAVLIAEGLGHAFVVTSDVAVVSYVVNQPYAPERELAINPLDEALGLDLGAGELVISAKDQDALSLSELQAKGMLPLLAEYRAL